MMAMGGGGRFAMADFAMEAAPMMMNKAPAAPPTNKKLVVPEKKEEPKEKKAGGDGEKKPLSQQDFASYDVIKKNTRDYQHKLRADYDRLTRVDFTQTLAFASGKIVPR